LIMQVGQATAMQFGAGVERLADAFRRRVR
jgi:hypothetical protein